MLHWFNKTIKPSKWNTPYWEPNWGRMNNGSSLLWSWRQIKRSIDSTEMSRWQKMYSLQEIQAGSPSEKVVTIAKHACDHVLKMVLKQSAYRLEIFLVKYEYLRSLQLCEDQAIRRKLKRNVSANMCLPFLQLIPRAGLKKCIRRLQQ